MTFDMASRLDFCNSLYFGIGDQGSTGQIWTSSDCGGLTHHWSSEIRPYIPLVLHVLAASGVFKEATGSCLFGQKKSVFNKRKK